MGRKPRLIEAFCRVGRGDGYYGRERGGRDPLIRLHEATLPDGRNLHIPDLWLKYTLRVTLAAKAVVAKKIERGRAIGRCVLRRMRFDGFPVDAR